MSRLTLMMRRPGDVSSVIMPAYTVKNLAKVGDRIATLRCLGNHPDGPPEDSMLLDLGNCLVHVVRVRVFQVYVTCDLSLESSITLCLQVGALSRSHDISLR